MAMDINSKSSDLDSVLAALEDLHLHAATAGSASNALARLADDSRSNQSTRERIAKPVVLQNLIEIIECSIHDSLESVDGALRCIGNACIDNKAAREEVTISGFSWASQCFQSDDARTQELTAKVLYNICSDYEPAQQQCFREQVHAHLIQLLGSESTREAEDSTLLVELLFWICGHKTSDEGELSRNELKLLVTLPELYYVVLDTEDYAMLFETCLLFLRDGQTQQDVISQKHVESLWSLLECNENEIVGLEGGGGGDDAKLLVPLSMSLMWCLSDIATQPAFVTEYGLKSELIENEVLDAIEHPNANRPRVASAACQLLGNLLWSIKSSQDYTYLVESENIHDPILTKINGTQDSDLLHSASGLLIHLAIPSYNVREVIGSNMKAAAAIEKLCRHEMPQIKQDGIRLLRALGQGCPSNQSRFADVAREVMASASSEDATITDGPD